MIHIIMMFMLVLATMGAASARSTIISLKLSTNYRDAVQSLYRTEGQVEFVLHQLAAGRDMDGDGVEDFSQVHGNGEVLYYLLDGVQVEVRRDPNDPHQAIITVGNIRVTVNNFPGGGESCAHNNHCTPERVAWEVILDYWFVSL